MGWQWLSPGRLAAALVLLSVIGGGLVVVAGLVLPLPEPLPPARVHLVDRNGLDLGQPPEEDYTRLDAMPEPLVRAVLAAEDHLFYRHHGFNPGGIARAAWRNLQAGGIVEGGSTITQQLAKILFVGARRSLDRKLREAVFTVALESRLDKDEILELYLNHMYLGEGAYGMAEAAALYFCRPVDRLTLPEAAMLAGIIRSPENLSPRSHPQAALGARRRVLDRMAEVGFITPEEAAAAAQAPLGLCPESARRTSAAAGGYARQYALEEMARLLPAGRRPSGATVRLTVWTTIDIQLQRLAETLTRRDLTDAAGARVRLGDGEGEAQVALLALDPSTGAIRAMIGGHDYEATPFNRAVYARRQPGSAFKPFVYVTALALGWPPSATAASGRPMREALQVSDNAAALDWLETAGAAQVVSWAHRLGIESTLHTNPSLALGTAEVTPLELAGAYATLAGGGLRAEPHIIDRVVSGDGRCFYRHHSRPARVLDSRVAYLITDLLRSVLRPGGTAAGAGRLLGRPAAGKTGTSQSARDAWFVGYTPGLLALVWIGSDRGTDGPAGDGGSLAAPLWARFMQAALTGTPVRDFPRPPGAVTATICPLSGLRPAPGCPRRQEVFLAGTAPLSRCTGGHDTEGSRAGPQGPTGRLQY